MSAAHELSGLTLEGDRGGLKWAIGDQLKSEPGITPGQFSVGYKAIREDGLEGFLKAADLSMAFDKDDPIKALREIANGHDFERTILEHCRGNRLDKIVTALDSGTTQVTFNGAKEYVFFIVFELAKSDLRKHVRVREGNDLAWVISAIHNISVAMAQIHSVSVYHNDLKPGNALIFEDTEKVADLGRASSPDFPVPHDKLLCAGDRRFAPPEQLYYSDNTSHALDRFIKSKAGDLYNLGSIMHYLITKRQLTPEVIARLDPAFRPASPGLGWYDSYEGVLPYWRSAQSTIMTEFYDDLPAEWNERYKFALDAVRDTIMHLCEPDFRLRGDLKDSDVSLSKYGLQRIISRMDNLRNRVMITARA